MSQIYGKIFKDGLLSRTHLKIIDLVGEKREVLELGSSTGYLTRQFVKNGCVVDIVEKDRDDAREAGRYARKTFIGSLDEKEFLNQLRGKYEVVVAADILEHLKNPAEILKILSKNFKKTGRLIISLPNVACWEIRRDLFFKGSFAYKESGILDKTHLRFFTFDTIQSMVKDSGYGIVKIIPIETSYPFKLLILRLRRPGRYLDSLISFVLVKLFPNFSVSHLIIEAKINE